jgi:diguanylate cyclase (GGDEF)-like protein
VAAAAETEAIHLRERTHELEQLSRCGQALGRTLSFDALRVAVWRHFPELLGQRDTWLALAGDGGWEMLADTRPDSVSWWESHVDEIARVADRLDVAPVPFDYQHHRCYPLVAHDAVVGILGIANPEAEIPLRLQQLGETLASLLAIAVHNVQLFAQIKSESTRDPLTGCLRRAPAVEMLETSLRRARRSHAPVSAIMFDLDGFKQINDEHGHQCGDRLLAEVGRLLNRQLRSSDGKCRYGGDEFLVILPETPANGARQVADGLRAAVSGLAITSRGQASGVTASVGVTTSEGTEDAEQMIARVDAALYAAKHAGRNCVRVDETQTQAAMDAIAISTENAGAPPRSSTSRKCA